MYTADVAQQFRYSIIHYAHNSQQAVWQCVFLKNIWVVYIVAKLLKMPWIKFKHCYSLQIKNPQGMPALHLFERETKTDGKLLLTVRLKDLISLPG